MPYYNDLRGKWIGSIYYGRRRMSKHFDTKEEAIQWEQMKREEFPAEKPWGMTECKARNSEEQKSKMRARAAKKRKEALQDMGPCIFCDSTTSIEMHHIDPSKKVSHRIYGRDVEFIKDELKKCVPLCPECHRKFEGLMHQRAIQHGTVSGYDEYGCRCSECLRAKMEKKRRIAKTKNG